MVTEWLGVSSASSIDRVINGTGDSATQNSRQSKTNYQGRS